ncbi:hypothetical protein BH11PSE8_BH11PSE8_18610 [soil metagenome]
MAFQAGDGVEAAMSAPCRPKGEYRSAKHGGFLTRALSASTWMLAAAVALSACANRPPPPDWQMNAKGSMERALEAYLTGNTRIEALEFARARAEVARTGQPELMARVELTRCAALVASLAFDDCPGFAALAADVGPAERAYAAYLRGAALSSFEAGLLPEQHRTVATSTSPAEALADIDDPLSRLVAAGALLRGGRAQPAVIAQAAATASARGWSRPLLAWLGVQAQRARDAGDADEAARLQRRMDWVAGKN